MVLEEKVENLKLKNDEFLRQNQTIIQEVVKKGYLIVLNKGNMLRN